MSDSVPSCSGNCAEGTTFDIAMAFQPVVDLDERRIYAYEALVRGPQGQSAQSVLDQVTPENRYSFDQSCRVVAIKTASDLGLDRRLNINFMPNAVYHPEACLRLTLDVSRQCAFPLENITFEFTENEKIIDRDHLKGIVSTYNRHGFMTALDDFGAGYAGLSLLADFVPDVIKLDRALVDGIDTSRNRQAIAAGLMAIARELDMIVVAEGVERAEEVQVLRQMGVTRFQGYYFSRPALGRLVREDEIPVL